MFLLVVKFTGIPKYIWLPLSTNFLGLLVSGVVEIEGVWNDKSINEISYFAHSNISIAFVFNGLSINGMMSLHQSLNSLLCRSVYRYIF